MTSKARQRETAIQINTPSPIEWISPDWLADSGVQLAVKRDDLIHPIISGNKWRKLKYLLPQLQQQPGQVVLSFGGGYSNHLHALGYLCYRLQHPFIAMVRGNYRDNLTPTLTDLLSWGARLEFVSKLDYQKREDADFLHTLSGTFAQPIIVPEGGATEFALQGVAELLDEQTDFDHTLLPVATGTTLAGLALSGKHQLTGIAVLKGEGYLERNVSHWLGASTCHNWHIAHSYHFGGYAKKTTELVDFCADFAQQTGIPIEPVYSGKLFWAIKDLVHKQHFAPGQKLLAIHTGGLQGQRQVMKITG